jgi:DnaK suppressor protein
MAELNDDKDVAKQKLVALRLQIEASLSGVEAETKPVDLGQPIGRLTRMDAMQMQSMAKANKEQLKQRLQMVGVALEAIERGEYGSCRLCEEPIGEARLNARPESAFCIACQERAERRR